MAYPVSKLETTPTDRWLAGMCRAKARTQYFHALRALLGEAHDPAYLPTRGELNEAMRHGSSSTIYSVFNQDSLVDALDPPPGRSRFGRLDIVGKAVVEVKVWSYGDYRSGWINALRRCASWPDRTVATSLLRTVVLWATREPEFAIARCYAPPYSAVQDLCMIVDGTLSETEAERLLQNVVETADGPLGVLPATVVDVVYDRLLDTAFQAPEAILRSLEGQREKVRDVLHLLARMSEDEVGRALPLGISVELLRRFAEGA
jgi:hypothetical protein